MKATSGTLLVLAAALTLSGCANIGPPEPPSLQLPRPPSDLLARRKGNKVVLTWTVPSVTTDRQRVRSLGPTRICRAPQPEFKECGAPVGEMLSPLPNPSSSKEQGSYTDVLPPALETDDLAGYATYAVEVLNADGRAAGLSNQVRVSLIRTLPHPTDFTAQVVPQGVLLEWIAQAPPAMPGVHYVNRVYRHEDGGKQTMAVGEVPVSGEGKLTFTDSSIEWEKTWEYRVDVVTLISRENEAQFEVAGEDSPEVKVFAHDTYPPAVPPGLQAVFSGPGQPLFIDLNWAPDTDFDLAGYNVYRSEEGAASVKLNAELLRTPAYRDQKVVSGKMYFYSVTAVDVRGNESARSEEAGETVP